MSLKINSKQFSGDYENAPIGKHTQKTVSKDSLIKAIENKLDNCVRFGNFFNGIHNRIANYFRKGRENALNALKDVLNDNNKDEVKKENLPKSIREKYKNYQEFLNKSSNSILLPKTIQSKESSTPKIAFGDKFIGAKTKADLNKSINLKEAWKKRDPAHIGKGAFGTVYTSKDEQLVFKEISDTEAYTDDLKGNETLFVGIGQLDKDQAFYNQGVGFVTKFLGEVETPEGKKVLVFERAPGMEFAEYLKVPQLASENINNKLYTHCALLGEAATAIAIAHEAGCVNRDIKSENIMIGQQQEQDGQITAVAKLIDQGLVYDLKQPSEDKNNLCGTPSFIAPEMLNGSVKTNGISPAADVFAMGVMLMEVLLPELNDVVDNFDKETCKTLGMVGQFDVEKNINRENFVTSLPDILTLRQQKLADDKKMPYSDDQLLFLGNLLKDCLAQKPEDRPSAAQVGELIQIFSASIGDPTNLMSYKDAKNLAEEDRPKAIPFAIRNMIADPNNHNAGFIALKELVKADKSYKTTLSYGLAMLYEDKYSKRGKFKKIFNKTTSFKQWAKENPSVASTLRARVYVKPNNPSEKQNIPVSQDFYDIIHSKQI